MTEKEKELLLKDICARLPYDDIYGEVHMQIVGESKPFIVKEKPITFDDVKDFMEEDGVIFNIKPYLRPMTDMDENEEWKYNYLKTEHTNWEAQDYLNPIHVDYRGLIEKGLALEAPIDMYNTK